MTVPATSEAGMWVPGYVPPLSAFLARRVIAAPGARLDWADVYREFAGQGWRSPPPPRHFGQAMAYICRARGIGIVEAEGRIYCPNMRLDG